MSDDPADDDRPVIVELDHPFASLNPGEPTIRIDVPTTPRFRSGVTVSARVARELISELQKRLDEIETGAQR